MASGVKIQDDVVVKFSDMKLKKVCYYMLLSLTDDLKEVKVAKMSDKDSTFDDLKKDLNEVVVAEECRYVILDFKANVKAASGKLLLFLWSPESSRVKSKMIYTSTMQALKSTLGDGYKEITALHDMSELDVDEIAKSIH